MDDLIESFISSPTWSDANASILSSCVGNTVSQSDFLLTDPEEAYGRNEKNPPIYMRSPSHIISSTYPEDFRSDKKDDTSSLFINGDLKYGINKGLFPCETICQHKLHKETMEPQVQQYSETPQNNLTLPGAIACNSTAQSYGQILNAPYTAVLPHGALAMSSSAESNDSQLSGFPPISDTPSFSSASAIWNSSYSNVSSLMGERKSQVFGFPGIESDDTLSAICYENGNIQIDNSPSASDYNEFQRHNLPSFTAGRQINLASDHMRTHQQWSSQTIGRNTSKHQIDHSTGTQSHLVPANGNDSGAAKPRTRARRGQATDPHSIAERLRREKITERMKNLQELVPSSNKADKASMLDEIIDYVKFLQLQVKVLSMSRLGAAGAVVPLLIDSQTEDSRNQLLSSEVQGGPGLSELQDNLVFEQEVVKLMESNVTTAMQHLQNKGLCLMPIALAAAISNKKGTSCSAIRPERRKLDGEHCVSTQWSQSYMEKNVSDDGANGCKSDDSKKEETSKSINNVMELKTQGIKAN
ncbi:uncharacterized protein [Typha latifolia]|uniref:uncharacterized protein n=1 Tax=Typha latifolia TaxID=4733 RepID=UPI003C30936C